MCGWFANHKALCKDKIVSFASLGLDVQKKKKGKEVGWRGSLLPDTKQIWFSQDSFTLEPGAQELDLKG